MNTKLWEGNESFKQNSCLTDYRHWLEANYSLTFESYEALWAWSVNDLESFWESLWAYFKIISYSPYKKVISTLQMPHTKWFEGSTLNYAEHIFRNSIPEETAIYFAKESGDLLEISWSELERKVAATASYLKSIGVRKGDRVVGFLPNIPEASISFLAVNTLGAIWSCTSPDFGTESVVDRFSQIRPKVMIAVDGYAYNDKTYDKTAVVSKIFHSLPSLEKLIALPYLDKKSIEKFPKGTISIDKVFSFPHEKLIFEPLPFDHPIWVLYSSGTTGTPKAIVHSHGGILLEHLKYMAFHNDVKYREKYFWYTTTGWMMWNFLQSALLTGASIVIYDGSPTHPNFYRLWELSGQVGIHHFGTSAPFLVASMKREVQPKTQIDLSSIRSISSTGAPLPHEAFEYVYKSIKSSVWLCSMAGGTDVCTAFVGGNPDAPVHAGEIQCRALGVSLYAYNENGEKVYDELGEMVIDQPMPSMPIYFWNDPEGKRYRESYFEVYQGKWRHGDYIKISGKTRGVVIYGRSDATLNRHGIRMGTSEIYRVIDKIEAIEDTLIVNLELEGGRHYMPLFVMMKEGEVLSDEVKIQINKLLKKECSPRHIPDDIVQTPDIPYTISGKKMEAPIKKILMGIPLEKAINRDAMRNPESVAFFVGFMRKVSC